MHDDLPSLIALRRMQLVDLKANADAGDDGAKAALERVGAELAKLEGFAEKARAAAEAAAAAVPATSSPAAPAVEPAPSTAAGAATVEDQLAELRRPLVDLVDHLNDAHTRITRLEATVANAGALAGS